MIKAIVPAAMVLAAGLMLILKRAPAARGFSLVMGGTVPPVVMIIFGAVLIAVALASVLLSALGMLG